MKKNNINQHVLKKIKLGQFKNDFLVYVRKSTDEAENQKNSIEYQKNEAKRFTSKFRLKVANISLKGFASDGFIIEKHSGFKESNELSFSSDGKVQYSVDRPKFLQMIQLLNAGYFRGVICLCMDRLSRNKADNTIVRKLLKKGVDFRFVYTNYDDSSSGALHMDIDEIFAEHHSRVTREKVTNITKSLRDEGVCTHRAPIGYLNKGNMYDKPFDPERSHFVIEMFELYSSGDWSLSKILRHINEQGFTMPPMRKFRTKEEMLDETIDIESRPKLSRPLTKSSLNRILQNRFYLGLIRNSEGEYIPSNSHKALVSEKTFNKVQKLLKKKNVGVKYINTINLPLRGIFRCSECNRSYTPYIKKGIQYFGVNCKKSCVNSFKNFNLDFVSKTVSQELMKIQFTDEELIIIDEELSEKLPQIEEQQLKESNSRIRKIKKVKEDLQYIHQNRLDLLKAELFTPKSMREEESKLLQKITDLEQHSYPSQQEILKTFGTVKKVSELLERLVFLYKKAKPIEKEQIIRNVFSELLVSNSGLKYKLQNEYLCLENRIVSLGGPIAWLSELASDKEGLKETTKKLEILISTKSGK